MRRRALAILIIALTVAPAVFAGERKPAVLEASEQVNARFKLGMIHPQRIPGAAIECSAKLGVASKGSLSGEGAHTEKALIQLKNAQKKTQ